MSKCSCPVRKVGWDNRTMIYAYPCELTPDEDGSFMATFPDVPEAITGGKDRTEALTMAEDALATALAGYILAQWEIPTPSQPAAGQELVAVNRSTLMSLVRSRTCHKS